MKKLSKLSFLLVAMLAMAFVGCENWLSSDPIPEPVPEPDPEPDTIVEALINLSESATTLHKGETYQILAESESPITFFSEDEYHAMVSDSGLVTANFVGNTIILLQSESDSVTFDVTVAPVSELYPEPDIEIGESKESVIEKLGQPGLEEDGSIGYENYSENAFLLAVMFDEYDLVSNYGLILDESVEEELDTFLSERYMFANEEDGIKIYMNALTPEDVTLFVASEFNEDEEYVMVLYMGNDNGGDEVKAATIKALLKSLRK